MRFARGSVHTESHEPNCMLVSHDRRINPVEVPTICDEAALHALARNGGNHVVEARMERYLAAGEGYIVDLVSVARLANNPGEQLGGKVVCFEVIESVLIAHAIAAMEITAIRQLDS